MAILHGADAPKLQAQTHPRMNTQLSPLSPSQRPSIGLSLFA